MNRVALWATKNGWLQSMGCHTSVLWAPKDEAVRLSGSFTAAELYAMARHMDGTEKLAFLNLPPPDDDPMIGLDPDHVRDVLERAQVAIEALREFVDGPQLGDPS